VVERKIRLVSVPVPSHLGRETGREGTGCPPPEKLQGVGLALVPGPHRLVALPWSRRGPDRRHHTIVTRRACRG